MRPWSEATVASIWHFIDTLVTGSWILFRAKDQWEQNCCHSVRRSGNWAVSLYVSENDKNSWRGALRWDVQPTVFMWHQSCGQCKQCREWKLHLSDNCGDHLCSFYPPPSLSLYLCSSSTSSLVFLQHPYLLCDRTLQLASDVMIKRCTCILSY